MALTYGFYNSVEGDRTYDAIQMGQIFDGIITDGVYATFLKAMVVKASENASEVIVQPGRCWFNHTWTYIDADYPVEAPAPEVILDRVDALVIDINTENAFRANSLVWVQGTPSSLNPERPTLIKSVTHNQYPLAYVYRKAGTTMIYAADITNAVGTSETPFVTGVLQGINIDDLLAQWDDEFHTWEAATKTSFEAWMVNQQSVYVTWFDSIKDQMEDDLTGFEAWFETIRGIIDEEAATHLQAEIDDILDMLPAGSHIDISTNEPTLFNRNVTVSDGVHSKTVQFNAIGGATVESFPYIGIINVSSTDGERIASESINIPYFGRYSVALAFWSATVNLVGDETLAGLAVTVRDSNGDVVAVVTLNGSGQGVFTATGPDTYKFIYTYGGQTMEVSLAVTQETTYEVEIHGGFRFDQWLLAGRVEEEFDTLDEILADEPTLRQLFLVHDSVDYICNTLTAGSLTDITKIFNTDLAAKWINLSDYALDHFYAVPEIKSIMDTANKYGYGEWVITDSTTTPPTWGPKGNIPVMTSDSAPYGTASASNVYVQHSAYIAFDGDSTTYWSGGNGSGPSIVYKFVNPICLKMVKGLTYNTEPLNKFVVAISNDGTNYTTLETKQYDANVVDFEVKTPNNTDYALYVKVTVDSTISPSIYKELVQLQFYGRELKVSVPVMTSNTAPFGEAFADSESSASYAAWKAFDGDDNTYAAGTSKLEHYWGYVFPSDVKVKMAMIYSSSIPVDHMYIESADSKNGEFSGEEFTVTASSSYKYFITLSEVQANKAIRFRAKKSTSFGGAINMQFYGLDYSEKEFEVGTTKKWLYDHGVELEEIIDYYSSGVSAGTIVKEDSDIIINAKSSNTWVGAGAHINLTPYNGLFGLLESVSTLGNDSCTVRVGHMSSNYIVTDSYSQLRTPHAPVILYLDVSSFNETKEVVADAYQGIELLKELWLE